MKKYEEPKLELIAFAMEDVVCTSGEEEQPPEIGSMLDPNSCIS